VVHFTWRVKADLRRPSIFAIAIGALLLARLVPWLAARRRRALAPVPEKASALPAQASAEAQRRRLP
jgi:DMSO/TMAO reductase YedYZ heme-binding membrane subunit